MNDLITIEREIQSLDIASMTSGFEKAIVTAQAFDSLRSALDDKTMASIMKLQGSSLGFRTDKDGDKGYPVAVVRDCLIEAVLRGVQPVGNHFNIIAGRCYITKEGFAYLLKKLPGFSDFRTMYGIPKSLTGGAIVACEASWKFNGIPDRLECEIPIKVNAGMGSDAILGKAARKLMARVYAQVTGSEMTDGDASEAEVVTVRSERLKRQSEIQESTTADQADDLDMSMSGGDK
jgi:acetylornithine deacetylase/succinyl-diaminopimelate desuccinylase-like protein